MAKTPRWICLILSALCFANPLSAQISEYVQVDTEMANLRIGPGVTHQSIGAVERGTRLPVIGRQGAWLRVSLPKELGFATESAYIHRSTVRQAEQMVIEQEKRPPQNPETDYTAPAPAVASNRTDQHSEVNRFAGFGAQLSYADDADFGVGGRLVFNLREWSPRLDAIITADVFFPGDGFADSPIPGVDFDVNYLEVNANLAYLIPLPEHSLLPYFGGGLNIARLTIEISGFGESESASDTEMGLNLLGGIRFSERPGFGGTIQPFGELRVEIEGGEQFVISGGVIF